MYTALISVTVVTYNSEETVLSTLNSIKEQTYDNIEIVVSDDCSTDNTLQLVKSWLADNGSRFKSFILLEMEKNKGVSANSNNAMKNCRGEWILGMAGDDILKPDAISNYMAYIEKNSAAQIVFSKCQDFTENAKGITYGRIRPDDKVKAFFGKSLEEQLKELLFVNYIPAPSNIIKRELIINKYPREEKYRYFEDYPYWVKLLRNGIKFYFMDSVTVLYRQNESASHSKKRYVNERLFLENERFFFEEIYPQNRENVSLVRYKRAIFFIQEFEVMFLNNNKSNLLGRLLLKYIRRVLTKWAGRPITF